MVTKVPEFGLEQQEAKDIAQAYCDLAIYYPLLDKISDRGTAHVNFAGAIGAVMIMHAREYSKRKKEERKPPPQPAQTPGANFNIHEFRPANIGPNGPTL